MEGLITKIRQIFGILECFLDADSKIPMGNSIPLSSFGPSLHYLLEMTLVRKRSLSMQNLFHLWGSLKGKMLTILCVAISGWDLSPENRCNVTKKKVIQGKMIELLENCL